MTSEKAIKIFTEQGFENPQWAVDTIKAAKTLDDLKEIMRQEQTCLEATQFVHFRITSLYKGDSSFLENTLYSAREKFVENGLSKEVIDYYISNGGGVDISIALQGQIYLGKLPEVEDMTKLRSFVKAADVYLFESLRNYVG